MVTKLISENVLFYTICWQEMKWKDEISVINFSGLPVLIKNAHNFSEKNLIIFKKLNYHNSSHTNTTLKISEEKYILKSRIKKY